MLPEVFGGPGIRRKSHRGPAVIDDDSDGLHAVRHWHGRDGEAGPRDRLQQLDRGRLHEGIAGP